MLAEKKLLSNVRAMPLQFFNGNWRRIYAGPYMMKPAGMIGVKLALEVPGPADLMLPIRDFSIPASKQATDKVVWQVLTMVADNRLVYVGCMGGLGRTGLFLALLAKAMGNPNCVGYVRANYNERAIETPLQERYSEMYDLGVTDWEMYKLKWRAVFHGWSPRGIDNLLS